MLLRLGESGAISILISSHVLDELHSALTHKAPAILPLVAVLVDRVRAEIVAAPDDSHLRLARGVTTHAGDAAVLAAAWQALPDFFVTLDRQHFLENPRLAEGVPFPVGTPGDALGWIRRRFLDDARGNAPGA